MNTKAGYSVMNMWTDVRFVIIVLCLSSSRCNAFMRKPFVVSTLRSVNIRLHRRYYFLFQNLDNNNDSNGSDVNGSLFIPPTPTLSYNTSELPDFDTFIDTSILPNDEKSNEDDEVFTADKLEAELLYQQYMAAAHALIKDEDNYQNSWWKRLGIGLRNFHQEARHGMQCIRKENVLEAMAAFDRAILLDESQPLPQRAILAYCLADYPTAITQFERDIRLIEKSRHAKAIELRVWLSAAYRQLGQENAAKKAIDYHNRDNQLPCDGQSRLMNITSQLYASIDDHEDAAIKNHDDEIDGDLISLLLTGSNDNTDNTRISLENKLLLRMIQKIDQELHNDPRDVAGSQFYYFMYLALYFDSAQTSYTNDRNTTNNSDRDNKENNQNLLQNEVTRSILTESFLRVPASAMRFNNQDMWYHVPRILYRYRFDKRLLLRDNHQNNHTNSQSSNNDDINNNGTVTINHSILKKNSKLKQKNKGKTTSSKNHNYVDDYDDDDESQQVVADAAAAAAGEDVLAQCADYNLTSLVPILQQRLQSFRIV